MTEFRLFFRPICARGLRADVKTTRSLGFDVMIHTDGMQVHKQKNKTDDQTPVTSAEQGTRARNRTENTSPRVSKEAP